MHTQHLMINIYLIRKNKISTQSRFSSNIKDYLQLSVKVIQGSRLSENQGQEVCIMPLKGLVPFLVLMETKIFKDYYVLLTSDNSHVHNIRVWPCPKVNIEIAPNNI